jgi:hypothetical protein
MTWTPDELKRLKGLRDAATPGPWECCPDLDVDLQKTGFARISGTNENLVVQDYVSLADAELIVSLVNADPLSRIEELERENEMLRADYFELRAEYGRMEDENDRLQRIIAGMREWLSTRRNTPDWTTIGMIEAKLDRLEKGDD